MRDGRVVPASFGSASRVPGRLPTLVPHTSQAHPSFPLLSGPFSHLPGLRRLPSVPNLNYRLPLKMNLDATCVPLKPFPQGTCILSLCVPYFSALTSRVSSAALG